MHVTPAGQLFTAIFFHPSLDIIPRCTEFYRWHEFITPCAKLSFWIQELASQLYELSNYNFAIHVSCLQRAKVNPKLFKFISIARTYHLFFELLI